MPQLSCKFDESKWNPYRVNMLTNSSGTNYAFNEHEDVSQYGPYAICIWGDAMLQLSCKFGKSIWNPYWLIVLTSTSDNNHVPNEHEDIDQYAIPSEIMPC